MERAYQKEKTIGIIIQMKGNERSELPIRLAFQRSQVFPALHGGQRKQGVICRDPGYGLQAELQLFNRAGTIKAIFVDTRFATIALYLNLSFDHIIAYT